MTVKEASGKFGLSKNSICELCRESQKSDVKYIQSVKLNGRWIINDSTEIVLTKSQIRNILFQIIRFKNSSNVAISRRCFPTDDILKKAVKDLCRLGLVTECYGENYIELFDSIMLTEEGFTYLISNAEKTIRNAPEIRLLNFETNVGLINT